MLPPDNRELLLELLRPETGYTLDSALGTTFTLDLFTLLQVPVAFLHQAGLLRDEHGDMDRFAILGSLRQFASKLTVFVQAGRINLPADLPPLTILLEPCVCEVLAPLERGKFHPKLWVLRFRRNAAGEEPLIRYRVLCLSRNLTFDRSWDTVVSLDGVLREHGAVKKENNRLADFIAALPTLPRAKLSPDRNESVRQMAEDLRRVEFVLPDGFDDYAFHHCGIESSKGSMFPPGERMLIVSPFVSASFVDRFTTSAQVTLVSRLEELDRLSHATLEKCARLFVLNRQAVGDDRDQSDDASTELDGLHAKIFVIERGRKCSVFTGSFNATKAAFENNVEFMIELRGQRSAHGVAAWVPFTNPPGRAPKARCFGDLLDIYDLDTHIEPIPDGEKAWDLACDAARLAVINANFKLEATKRESLFEVQLIADDPIVLSEPHHLWAWPASVGRGHARELGELTTSVSFPMLRRDAVTAWTAFELREHAGSRQCVWVMKLDLIGAPADREARLLADILQSREELLRFLLLMLGLDDQGPFAPPGTNPRPPTRRRAGAEIELQPPLLETLLRVAYRNPQTLNGIANLMQDLRKTEEGAALEKDESLRRVWEPIWEAVQ
jgi:hypothetical protein